MRSATGGATSSRRRGSRRQPPPRRRFGQHFLEPAWVDRLVALIEPAPDDTFLEIGPGRGALTAALAPRVRRIVAVEIDRDLATALPGRVPANVDVVAGDFLAIDLDALIRSAPPPMRVAANLPYNVASPILFQLLHAADEGRRLRDATLMLQSEVADRLIAAAGTRDYGAMALQVRLLADVERVLVLPPGAFRPRPRVTSAVVRLRFRPPQVDVGNVATYGRLVRGLFLHRRKTLRNALRPLAASFDRQADAVIVEAALDPSARPEQLTIEDMARLTRAVL